MSKRNSGAHGANARLRSRVGGACLRSARAWAASLGLILLAACGGGGDERTATAGEPAREGPAAFFPSVTIPSDAHQNGMWSPVYNWPLISVHAVLLPDGRVLTYGSNADGQQTGKFIYDLWDGAGAPDAGHSTLVNTSITDIFCSSMLVLPNRGGDVFIAGGDNWTGTATTNTGNNNTNIISAATGAITQGPNLNRARWYSSSTTLINGETYIQGGYSGSDRAEIRALDGSLRLLSANTGSLVPLFPRNFVAPDGRVFGYDSNGRMYYMNTAGSGQLTLLGQLPSANRGDDASAAMFRPGRILQFGGASNGAVVIDINGGTPTVTATQSMSTQRRLVNATLLADGKVLATGGSQVWNQLTGVNNRAEIWNPQTGQWTLGAAGDRARLYHSNALLMPDASVMVMGGGAPGPQNNTNVEVYYPPYLFVAGGQRAPRPVIQSAPNAIEIGETFPIDVGAGANIARVTLVKTGSTTHSFNMEQRFQDLNFLVDGQRLSVQAPTRAVDAPPGYYMVFVIDSAGVPSMASMLRIGIAADPNPDVTPTLVTPSSQTATVGIATSLQLQAQDPNADNLRYGVGGLPAGLSLDSSSGLITGVPLQTGSYDVAVTVSDGYNATSTHFPWSVVAPQPLAFEQLPTPTPVDTSGTIVYTAAATGVNVRYSWNFGDGTPATVWSASAEISHGFEAAGTYSVTVSITDDSGDLRSRSFLQTVYLPTTSGKPSQSGNLLVETPATGSARLWVVNQDNDSVSAFDAQTQTKLGEVVVGEAPRAIAQAGNGQLWVTNKRSATVSVIDPASRSVVRTITLPRASQPFGVVMSPDGQRAYVVLEATGTLLEFAITGSAPLRQLAVGANARHVSVNGDGSRLYVSRFITPPLPGESTLNVAPTASTGGEVLEVGTTNLNLVRTIVLHHGDQPDFENQGRGIPNYLGAVAISPDGTQAWVPSKQDNVKRGSRRDGSALNFQSTVRAISSRVVLATGAEDLGRRIDHDNASLASAAVFDPLGVYLFVALETSREVAVIDAHGAYQVMRFDVGRAPQGLALSADGMTLYVSNFMDRSVGVYDLRPLREQGEIAVPRLTTLDAVASEKLTPTVLLGKQYFYDARDTRLARDRYMSCASCHNDGGHDGRTWDFSHNGEGLRNTINLRGRSGAQGQLHWTANFDEVQDFEGQIRSLAGGLGLMDNSDFNAGTRAQPLGDPKAGLSADLDALAAYVASLSSVDASPYRAGDGTLTAAAVAGKQVFGAVGCASCHAGSSFTLSAGTSAMRNVGTIKASSGQRLGSTLTALDVPSLRDVWQTAPYLHDGSAATLTAAVQAHTGVSLNATDLANMAAYLQQIGGDEPSPAVPMPPAAAVVCASERASCTIPTGKTATVWFGAAVSWVARTGVSGSITCANWIFGDPLPGASKGCRYVVTSGGSGSNLPPSVSITSPSNNASIAQGTPITLTAAASDSDGAIARVEFRDGATVLASVTTAPYTATWNGAAAGVHALTAWALDDEGASTTSAAIAVTVVTVTEPTTPPPNAVACAAERQTCTIPTGATATVWFGTGSTWASKSGVTGSITCANWIFGDPAPGASKSCRYVVTSGGGNQAPSVVLTSPSPNANVAQGTPIALAASASDADGSIGRVEFYDGATLIATVNDAPFSATWSGAAAGVHSVSAVAYDDGGLSATSATVAVSVVPPAQPPAETVTCAAERATCVVPAGRTATVWFGVGTSWVFKTGVSGSITCANWVFGDPLPGATKSCRML